MELLQAIYFFKPIHQIIRLDNFFKSNLKVKLMHELFEIKDILSLKSRSVI